MHYKVYFIVIWQWKVDENNDNPEALAHSVSHSIILWRHGVRIAYAGNALKSNLATDGVYSGHRIIGIQPFL